MRDGRWYWHWDPAFLTKPDDDPFVRVEKLEQAAIDLEIPILLIRGKLSDVVSAEGVEDFLAKVPHAEFVELSGAGHTAAGDDNDAFTRSWSHSCTALKRTQRGLQLPRSSPSCPPRR